jgi:hypothetical protein
MKFYINYNYLYHSLIGFAYLAAFLSLYFEYSGLLGINGLQPAETYIIHLRKEVLHINDKNILLSHSNYSFKLLLQYYLKLPSFAAFSVEFGVTVDAMMNFIIIIGSIVSSLISAGYHSSILYVICFLSYLSLFIVGQQWMSFQWDILLLETGFLAIFSAPYFINPSKVSYKSNHYFIWCYRFLAFKLMFLSGIVKLNANCPTWNDLSALEYHFATQCIPTPVAYYVHQLPPILLRLLVGITLVVEIPLAILLLAPTRMIRRFGASLQVLLQVAILVSGNYNFFNLLTIALMMACCAECDDRDDDNSNNNNDNDNYFITNLSIVDLKGPILSLTLLLKSFSKSILFKWLELIILLIFIYYSITTMLLFERNDSSVWWEGSQLKLIVNDKFNRNILLKICTFAMVITLIHITSLYIYQFDQIYNAFNSSTKSNTFMKKLSFYSRNIKDLFIYLISMLIILLSTINFNSICNINTLFHEKIHLLFQSLSSFHVFNSYGLFRRMTGVGSNHKVARPEIILEGLVSNKNGEDNENWLEIPFKFKPQLINKPLSFVIPFQPRCEILYLNYKFYIF